MTSRNKRPDYKIGDIETRLSHAGMDLSGERQVVNPPVYHASTVLFPTLADLRQASDSPFDGLYYGRFGTPTQRALESAYAELNGAEGCVSVGSGLSAITTVLSMLASRGQHMLVADNVYDPTRKFCDGLLSGWGIETEYFDPARPDQLAECFRKDTAGVFIESPGSMTFELTDVPAVSAICRAKDVPLVLDNTWATPLFFDEYEHGVNIAINAATKYVVGHADALLGLITCDATWYRPVRSAAIALGQYAAPDDAYLALRGLRTLALRLTQHEQQAQALCHWLAEQPEVQQILWPAWSEHPQHDIWQRDFTGASGLFSVLLSPVSDDALSAFLDNLRWFGLGYSWGGFESLVLPMNPATCRTAKPWQQEGVLLRIHAGLESSEDLIDDLAAGFERMRSYS